MNQNLLDNPGWYALNSHHRHLAIWGKMAVQYQPGTLVVGAMPENNFFIGIIFILAGLGVVWMRGNSAIQSEAALSINLIGDSNTPMGFTRADGSHIWDFPADFGPHPDYQTEWWYYRGNLQTQEGHRFGYQLTFFRRGLTPLEEVEERDSLWGGNQVYMGHFALSDINANEPTILSGLLAVQLDYQAHKLNPTKSGWRIGKWCKGPMANCKCVLSRMEFRLIWC